MPGSPAVPRSPGRSPGGAGARGVAGPRRAQRSPATTRIELGLGATAGACRTRASWSVPPGRRRRAVRGAGDHQGQPPTSTGGRPGPVARWTSGSSRGEWSRQTVGRPYAAGPDRRGPRTPARSSVVVHRAPPTSSGPSAPSAADLEHGCRAQRVRHLGDDGPSSRRRPGPRCRSRPLSGGRPPSAGRSPPGRSGLTAARRSPVDHPDPGVDGLEPGGTQQAVPVNLLVVVDDGRGGAGRTGAGRHRGRGGSTGRRAAEPIPRRRAQGHGDLVDVDRQSEERSPVEEPAGPASPSPSATGASRGTGPGRARR